MSKRFSQVQERWAAFYKKARAKGTLLISSPIFIGGLSILVTILLLWQLPEYQMADLQQHIDAEKRGQVACFIL